MNYAELAPTETLRAEVRCYWFLRDGHEPTFLGGGASADEPAADPAFPDGSPELILNLADPFIAIDSTGRERKQPLAFLVGQITAPFHVRPSGRVDLVGIRLESCGACWLADDLSALTGKFRAVDRLRGASLERLRVELAAENDPSARASVLDGALQPLVAAGRRPDWRVRDAVREIRSSGGLGDIGDLAKRLGTTPRTLQRRFATDVGITPKLLARIVRFQRVFSAWREDPTSLSRVAAECGYYDHAHLVRDFRELAGVTPARFLPNQPEFTRFFTS